MSHNFKKLKEYILALSMSKGFHEAKKEWELFDVKIRQHWDCCPCGKRIKELCYIKNQINGNQTYVGNVCVNQFIGIKTGNLFEGLKRITKNISANANEDLIIHAFKLGYIYENEFNFLMQTRRKQKLTDKQISWKKKINWRIINKTTVKEDQ